VLAIVISGIFYSVASRLHYPFIARDEQNCTLRDSQSEGDGRDSPNVEVRKLSAAVTKP
jgi:hypothetical protein